MERLCFCTGNLKWRLFWHRQINVALDLIFSMALFSSAGGLAGGVAWASLLPLFSSAIYFEARGALLTAILASAVQIGYTYLFLNHQVHPLVFGAIAGFNLAVGIVAGIVVDAINEPAAPFLSVYHEPAPGKRRKAQRLERDRMRALFSMIETFRTQLNYQTVLDTVLNTAPQRAW